MVGTKKGIWRTRSVRRKPIELRWKTENMEMVGGVPWKMNENDEKVDGEGLRGGVVRFENVGPMREEEEDEVRRSVGAVPPRTFSTSTEDYNKHGFTQKCAGCRAILTGTTRQKHSEACRTRMTTAMAGEEKVKSAKKRKQEFAKVVLEAEGRPSGEEEKAEEEKTKEDDMVVEEGQASSSSSGATKRMGEETGEEDEKPSKKAKEEAKSSSGSTKRSKEGDDDEEMPSKRAKEMEKEIGELDVNQEDEDSQWAVDDRNGELLDVKMVKEARNEEVKFMEGLGVWERSSLEECRRLTGKDPVSTRWVDIDKGRDREVEVRRRLVAGGQGLQDQGGSERLRCVRGNATAGGEEDADQDGQGEWSRGGAAESRKGEAHVRGREEGPSEWEAEGRRVCFRRAAQRGWRRSGQAQEVAVWDEACSECMGG